MIIKSFTFNAFQENTYVLYDHTKECVIVDPGCQVINEEKQLFQFIEKNQLSPKAILNTHCHIDHVFGINAVKSKYNIPFYCHEGEIEGLKRVPSYAPVYGFQVEEIAPPEKTIDENELFLFGETELEIRFTPGHSPASVCFIHHKSKQVIAGDVLFRNSIGRTDLPGGNYQTLMKSIEDKLLTLDNSYKLFAGHGMTTTIGEERLNNPFILEYMQLKQ